MLPWFGYVTPCPLGSRVLVDDSWEGEVAEVSFTRGPSPDGPFRIVTRYKVWSDEDNMVMCEEHQVRPL